MAEPVLWPIGEHTPGKHLVLEEYLKAWFPILGQTERRIVFIDGFCGPGEYSGGEPGSPIVALRTFMEHSARSRIGADVSFFFIDDDARRIHHLKELVAREWPSFPPNVHVKFENGRFDATMLAGLDEIEAAGKQRAPTFVMADPFGISQTPMIMFERLLKNEKCELYISFMWEYFNRFKESDEYPPHLDLLFGSGKWRDGIALEDPMRRRGFIFGLYERQLRAAGAKQVVHFELYQGNRLKYAIFFATKHLKGCDRMKQAIWKVDPFDGFAFRSARGNQLNLEIGESNHSRLANELHARFADAGFVSIQKLESYCASDETDFHTGHLKSVLKSLEDAREIEIEEGSRRRSRTFPEGTRLRFRSPAGGV